MWKIIRKIKSETPIGEFWDTFPYNFKFCCTHYVGTSYQCGVTGQFVPDSDRRKQVAAVEKQLQISSLETRYANISKQDLKSAAEMYIYLNTCASGTDGFDLWFKPWFSFYNNLFKTQSAEQIILVLSRMIKTKSFHNKDGKVRAKKLFKRAASLLSLRYRKIQNFLPQRQDRNEFDKGNQELSSEDCTYLLCVTLLQSHF